jgi:UTP--glucose-1-phosphate uridylyltransferase
MTLSSIVRKAVIPAAGLGTRFLPVTKTLPKEMLPIIDIPTIQLIVEEAVASGIHDILIITNAHKAELENYFDVHYELETIEGSGKKMTLLHMYVQVPILPINPFCASKRA